jgi:phage terminase large subunit-like protein
MTSSPAALELCTDGASADAPAYFDVEAWAARTARPGDTFDEIDAAHACAFFPRYLTHSKGKWAGQPFELIGWQRAIVRAAFGWKRADGTRRFRKVYLEVARKNGKTQLAAGIALYLAFFSGEPGAEVYCAASNEDQALICFNEAKRMRGRSAYMKNTINAFKGNLSSTKVENGSKLEAITGRSDTKDGLNASGIIGDEFHAWKDRNLYDVLTTSTGAREQPLEVYITTAGTDEHSICYETREHAINVRDGVIEDHEMLPVIYAAGKDDPIDDPRTWAKANPSLGITVKPDYIAKKLKQARDMPRFMNTFQRLHLNIWTDAATTWIPREDWDRCNLRPVTLDALKGRACYGGLDLSAVTDLTALALFFPDDEAAADLSGDIWVHCWLPRGDGDALRERIKRDKVPYDLWAEQGLLTLTEGNVVDYDAIRAAVTGVAGDPPAAWGAPLRDLVEIRDIARDSWNATQITNQLMSDGAAMIDFGQGYRSMSAPAKEWEKMVLGQRLNHGGNPLLRWTNSCCAVMQDPAGNIKPVKPDRKMSSKRIDPIVAAIMAVGRAIAVRDESDRPPVVEIPVGYSMTAVA